VCAARPSALARVRPETRNLLRHRLANHGKVGGVLAPGFSIDPVRLPDWPPRAERPEEQRQQQPTLKGRKRSTFTRAAHPRRKHFQFQSLQAIVALP